MPSPRLLAAYAELAIAQLAQRRPEIMEIDPIVLRREAIRVVMAEFHDKPPVIDPE